MMHEAFHQYFDCRKICIFKTINNGTLNLLILLYIKYIQLVECGKNMFSTRPTHWRTDANLYPPERQLTKAIEPSFDLEAEAKSEI